VAQVIVIGAGIGGLAAAARLSVKGHHVTILEQSDSVGGKARGYCRDGFVFDTGPSLLTLPAVYRDLFLKTGSAFEENVDLQPVEPGTAYWWTDGTHVTLPGVNPAAAANALGQVFGTQARDDWLALMARAADIWDITRRPFLESPLSGLRDLLSLAKDPGSVKTVAPWQTLRSLGKQYLRDPHLRDLLDRYATYSGSDPRKAPAALSTVPYVEQTFGSWHIGGGVHKLADALAARCAERNVTIELGADVARINLTDGAVSSVTTTDVISMLRSWLPTLTLRTSTPTCWRMHARGGRYAVSVRQPPLSQVSSSCSRLKDGRLASHTTTCGSEPTTTMSSTRCSGESQRWIPPSTRVYLTIQRCAPTTGMNPGFS
jgi:phytoene desaturase